MDKDWVMAAIEKIAGIGKGKQGVTRLAYTQPDMQARKLVIEWMEEVGLSVVVDPIGNIIGRLDGKAENLPAVMTGSHLDTVPAGGKYDGVVGVIGGLAAIKRIKERGSCSHPLEVVVFAAEESSRFGYASFGSKAMIGLSDSRGWSRIKDHNGILFPQALQDAGLNFADIDQAKRESATVKAFVELHIEQGKVLEKEERQIGIVEWIAAPTRCKITVEGVSDHSGTTPMDERQDALVSAAMIVLAVQEIALEESYSGTVATVGNMKVYPGAMNVIPGLVEMWVDIRGTEQESIIECLQAIKDAISTIADAQETSVSIEILSSEKPVRLDTDVIQTISTVCEKQHISHLHINSRAGHDAMNIAGVAPTGMIFIPSQGGISHNPDEYSSPEAIMIGIDVLTEVLYDLAK